MSSTFTMRLSDSQKSLISEYASVNGKTMSEFVLETTLDAIEDAIDLRDWQMAKKEHDENPVTYSAEEIRERYL